MFTFWSAVVVTLCVVGQAFAQYGTEFPFSRIALQIPEELGRRQVRYGGNIVPHLYQAEALRVSMCVKQATTVRIDNIYYSNDGMADTVTAQVDGKYVGQFVTHADSDWGKLWTNKSQSGFIGETEMLKPGRYDLTFIVTRSGDCFGLELWSAEFTLLNPVDPTEFWCGSSYVLAEKKQDCGGTRTEDHVIIPATEPPPSYVKVSQLSRRTHCFDKKNVKIMFSTERLVDTTITVAQQSIPTQAPQFAVVRPNIDGRLCNKEIWQLGEMDKSNNEFSSIYPGKFFTMNITDEENQARNFPMKLLPFATSDIFINFDMPPHVDMKEGSAFFALGLLNVTKPVDVSMRYYDNTIGDFSLSHVVTFTPKYQIFGWNIPNLGKSKAVKNSFHLHFRSEANVVMFDFLKLLYTERDARKRKSTIGKKNHWKVSGLRYENSIGMTVVVDHMNSSVNIEDAIIMYQTGDFTRHYTVIRVSSDGVFYPYKTFFFNQDSTESTIVDVSGFYFNNDSDLSVNPAPRQIDLLFIDTTTGELKAVFQDKSYVELRLIISADETKIKIISDTRARDGSKSGLVFTSTYVNEYYAAINTIENEEKDLQIMADVETLSGGHNYTLRKTTPSNLFYSNSYTNIHFPK